MKPTTRRTALSTTLGMALMTVGQVMAATDPGLQEWVRVDTANVAAECGLDPALLAEADKKMRGNPYAVVRYGKLCHEFGNTTGTFQVASITKFMSSLTFGIATTKTALSDESQVSDYLKPWQMGLINRTAKVGHVLAMTSTKWNLAWGKKGTWSYDALGWREIDKLIPIVETALAREPGAFPGVTTMEQLAKTQLFDKIGMGNTTWKGQSVGYSMSSNVRDIARLGLLQLRKGMWDGQTILSEEYVYRMGHPAFEDTNTGYGYLLMMNALKNQKYSSGSNDATCAPVSLWSSYPHRPLFTAPNCNGGNATCTQQYDVGTRWAAGVGGHKVVIHPGLDLVMVVRGDLSNEGHNNVWNAVRPALVKLDPHYSGNEAGFCSAYKNNAYAPDLR